jgi:hypothetical protein
MLDQDVLQPFGAVLICSLWWCRHKTRQWVMEKMEVFYGTQYHPITPVDETDSYVIEKDLYVRIRRLRLILYHRFF